MKLIFLKNFLSFYGNTLTQVKSLKKKKLSGKCTMATSCDHFMTNQKQTRILWNEEMHTPMVGERRNMPTDVLISSRFPDDVVPVGLKGFI